MFSLDFLLCDSYEFVVLERNHGPVPVLCDHGLVYQEVFVCVCVCVCVFIINIFCNAFASSRIHVCVFSQFDVDMGIRKKHTTNAWEA